jgi:hypothetical protein
VHAVKTRILFVGFTPPIPTWGTSMAYYRHFVERKDFEIFEPGIVRRYYWSLCRTVGHEHACGVGRLVRQVGNEEDIEVAAAAMIQELEKLGF